MGKFAGKMAAKAVKTDNHPARANAKVALRRRVLASIGAGEAQVFDAFAGSGAMHRAVWHDAAGYVGCDLRWFGGDRRAFVADNLRVLRAIDLARFTIFDLDAYGSPWRQAMIVAARRALVPGEKLALVLTDGSPMKARLGAVPADLAALAGVPREAAGMSKRWRELTARALTTLAGQMGGELLEFWAADIGSRPILYSAAVIGGRSAS